MNLPKLLLVGAIGVTSFAIVPTAANAFTCRQLCSEFMPKSGVTEQYGYGCQDQIDDNGGNCVDDYGRMNFANRTEPYLGQYRRYTGTILRGVNGEIISAQGVQPTASAPGVR